MWWKSRQLAPLLLFAIFWLCISATANAQKMRLPLAQYNHVISVTEDTSGNFVLLNTSNRSILPRPFIQYIPAADGQTQMLVDFPSAWLDAPSCRINLPSSFIRTIHIGQLQTNPPVLRMSMLAPRREDFRNIEFRAAPGSLIVRLPVGQWGQTELRPAIQPKSGAGESACPPRAPDVVSGKSKDRAPRPAPEAALFTAAGQLRGPITCSPAEPLVPFARNPELAPALKSRAPLSLPPARKPDQNAQAIAPALPAHSNAAAAARTVSEKIDGENSGSKPEKSAEEQVCQPLSLDLSGEDPLTIRLNSTRPVSFHCFRLHEPERYVVDIEGLDGNSPMEPPALQPNPWVKSLRTGTPEDNENMTRLVLDLLRPDVAVLPLVDSKNNSLTLTLKQPLPTMQEIRPPEGATVVLDAGHGGSDPGAQRGDVQEKEITLSLVTRLKKDLERRGVRVVLTRADDTFVSLEDRVKITNDIAPDAFVSVHINSLETNNAIQGIETYYQNDKSKDLAQLIHESLVNKLTVPDRSVRKARFYVINHTSHPAILAEVGFISNKEERDKLISSDYQLQVSEALANGVILYLASKADTIGRNGIEDRAEPAIAPGKTFTQNLQSSIQGQAESKPAKLASGEVPPKTAVAGKKQKLNHQQLRSKQKHLASAKRS